MAWLHNMQLEMHICRHWTALRPTPPIEAASTLEEITAEKRPVVQLCRTSSQDRFLGTNACVNPATV